MTKQHPNSALRKRAVGGGNAAASSPSHPNDALAGPSSSDGGSRKSTSSNKGVKGVGGIFRFRLPVWYESGEWIWMFAIVLLCGLTRYWRLDEPRAVVFDETHFGRFTNQYFAGAYLFDIHPPLGKLVFVLICTIVGYDWTKCGYANIADVYAPDCKFLWIRGTAAAFGTLTAPIIYVITRNWGGSKLAGVIAASAFIFDGLNTTEDRLILTDSQLIFWCAASLALAQLWWERYNDHTAAVIAWKERNGSRNASPSRRDMGTINAQGGIAGKFFHYGIEQLAWLVLIGVVTANAVSVKWTALATPGMIAIESTFGIFFLRKAVPFHYLLIVGAVAFATYATYFAIHFALLPNTGDGDAFMKIDFQRALVNNSNYDPIARAPGFWKNFFYLNGEMLSANARIAVRHGWESKWYEWPLNLRGLLYYSHDVEGTESTETVYLLGNPLVLWPMLLFLFVTVLMVAFFIRYRHEPGLNIKVHERYFPVVAYCTIAYSLNLLPYIAVNRSAFIYHYMPALMYAEVLSALTMDRLFGPRFMPTASKVMVLIMVSGFVYFMPWIYALPLTSAGHASRRWFKRWD